uniref:Putative ovule protein n=1 Tax=Solanum chacoense TaxID=4108 RepID=A0A0V0I5D5_SOLCH
MDNLSTFILFLRLTLTILLANCQLLSSLVARLELVTLSRKFFNFFRLSQAWGTILFFIFDELSSLNLFNLVMLTK